MNHYILILKGTNKELGTYEFETLWNTYFNEKIKLKQIHNTFFEFKSKQIIKQDHELLTRLTNTNYIGLCSYQGNFKDFESNLPDLKKYDKKPFAVRPKRIIEDFELPIEPAKLAKPIYNSFKEPIVDLENPNQVFNFFFKSKTQFYFCEQILENEKDYLRRMPKKRPKVMPYTLKSDMARTSINYLDLKEGTVLDPFCGQGGILLEAQDMNFEIIGNDISWNDLKYFKENFKYFFPDAKPKRILADSKTMFLKKNSVDGIVTDIPYGRASKKLGTDLYEQFLISSKEYLKPNKRMVVIYANFVEFKKLALKYFLEVKEIKEYINKSMTRHILILENKK